MQALCRDCLSAFDAPPSRDCPRCGSHRVLSHAELGTLAIAHIDCDAFYAAVEKRDDPALADKPVIVGGGARGVVTTCCYIARIAGVRSAMPMFKALSLCPDAVIVRPRFDVYTAASRSIRDLMLSVTPAVEPLSLDEAFLDLTGTERLLGAPPAVSLARLALRIEREVGITVSIGLSHAKFLAKLASDLDKPRGFAVIGRAETTEVLAPMPVGRLWGVGHASRARLEAAGFRTIGDIQRAPADALLGSEGAIGQRLWELARGIDRRTVDPRAGAKSISSETTFSDDISDRDRLAGHLWRLAVKTSDRAKAKGLVGATVVLKLKTARFRSLTRQQKPPEPTQFAETVYRTAEPLLDRMVRDGPFRLIGVGLTGLAPAPETEAAPALFEDDTARHARAELITDRIRARFGPDAIIRGRALK